MTYDLYLGDRTYSSWSLRGWLLFEKFGLACNTHFVDFNSGTVAAQLEKIAPAKTVPALQIDNTLVLSDSLAIAEELASRHPTLGIWPTDQDARATARNLCAEMHSGFMNLRSECPMNLRIAYTSVPLDADLKADLQRLEKIWDHARSVTKPKGPWLCGDYSAADAFFAPIAGRIAGYGLPVSAAAKAYVDAHLADPAFRRWRAMGFAAGDVLTWYNKSHEQVSWPGPTPIPAKAVEAGDAENEQCPYSGKEVTHLAEIDGRIFGFCNAFCRDKTVVDAAAFPAFIEIYNHG